MCITILCRSNIFIFAISYPYTKFACRSQMYACCSGKLVFLLNTSLTDFLLSHALIYYLSGTFSNPRYLDGADYQMHVLPYLVILSPSQMTNRFQSNYLLSLFKFLSLCNQSRYAVFFLLASSLHAKKGSYIIILLFFDSMLDIHKFQIGGLPKFSEIHKL